MDNTPDNQTTPKAIPVMDIQPPQTTQSTPPQDVESNAPEATPPAAAPVETASVAPAPVDDTAPTEDPQPATPLISEAPAAANNHKAPIGAIVVAVIVAVALAGVAVFTYSTNNNKTPVADTAPTTSQTTEEQVTASDIDETNKEIDDSLNQADEAADFNTDSLSDSSLAL